VDRMLSVDLHCGQIQVRSLLALRVQKYNYRHLRSCSYASSSCLFSSVCYILTKLYEAYGGAAWQGLIRHAFVHPKFTTTCCRLIQKKKNILTMRGWQGFFQLTYADVC